MCIIASSRVGMRQPTDKEFTACFVNNPHGAGYMFARNGEIHIHKGFMTLHDFLSAVHAEKFTADDAVVYHFRISTQAGISPFMTHPFPWSKNLEDMELLDCVSKECAFAHNGIIHCTSDPNNKRHSDTALFITKLMPSIIQGDADLRDDKVLDLIDTMTNSKWAIMDSSGYIAHVGEFINDDGLLFSNHSFQTQPYRYTPYSHFSLD